jgi:hypothetical protein
METYALYHTVTGERLKLAPMTFQESEIQNKEFKKHHLAFQWLVHEEQERANISSLFAAIS